MIKRIKEFINKGMIDRFIRCITREVTLCYIGLVQLIMHQHAVPGLISRRSAFCDNVIPFIRTQKNRVCVNYYTTVVKQLVCYTLADGEFCLLHL